MLAKFCSLLFYKKGEKIEWKRETERSKKKERCGCVVKEFHGE
jgi:hypothetical protein